MLLPPHQPEHMKKPGSKRNHGASGLEVAAVLVNGVGRETNHVVGLKLICDSVVHLPSLAPETKNRGCGDMPMDAAHRNVRCDVDDMGGKAIERAANQDIVARQITCLVRAALAHDRCLRC